VRVFVEAAHEVLDQAGLKVSDLDWFVPHQANIRIMEATAIKLGLPVEKVIATVDHHGNTSAASIPLALDEAVRDGRIRPGQTLLLEAVGEDLPGRGVVALVNATTEDRVCLSGAGLAVGRHDAVIRRSAWRTRDVCAGLQNAEAGSLKLVAEGPAEDSISPPIRSL
jgi:hypothetical protein